MLAGWVDVEMEQMRASRRVLNRQARLLRCLARGRILGRLVLLDVATGLQPYPKALVAVQHRSYWTDDDRRCGDVHQIRISAEGIDQPVELSEESVARALLPRAARVEGIDGGT